MKILKGKTTQANVKKNKIIGGFRKEKIAARKNK